MWIVSIKILRMMSHVLPEAIEDSGAVSLKYWGKKKQKQTKKLPSRILCPAKFLSKLKAMISRLTNLQ